MSTSKPVRTISEQYALLNNMTFQARANFRKFWGSALSRTIPDEEWSISYLYINSSPLSSRYQEHNCKLSKWYRWPTTVQKRCFLNHLICVGAVKQHQVRIFIAGDLVWGFNLFGTRCFMFTVKFNRTHWLSLQKLLFYLFFLGLTEVAARIVIARH